MIDYIYDFLSVLSAKAKMDKIKSIILFGSFARGESRKDSDIDLFININNKDKKEIELAVKNSLNEFEIRAEKSWHLKGIKNSIQPIIDDISLDKWRELRNEISLYGKIIFGSATLQDKNSNPFALIEYDISKLKQKDKMNILRTIYGYKNNINGKIYEHKGMLHEEKGEKISNGLIIPLENTKKIIAFFRKKNIPIKIRNL